MILKTNASHVHTIRKWPEDVNRYRYMRAFLHAKRKYRSHVGRQSRTPCRHELTNNGLFCKCAAAPACIKYDCLHDEAHIAHWSFADPGSFASLTTFFC